MIQRKFFNLLLSLFVIASLLFGPSSQVRAQTPPPPSMGDGTTHTHQGMVMPADREAAADRAAANRAKNGQVAMNSLPAGVNVPGGIPDYFGTTPNYANSPQALLDISVSISGGGGSGAAAQAIVSGLTSISVTNGGSGYTSAPNVVITGGGGSGATAIASIAGGAVTGITLTNSGAGYLFAPQVSFSGGGGSGAAAAAKAAPGAVTGLVLTSGGAGYTSAPTVTIESSVGFSAQATASVSGGKVTGLTLVSGGAGYGLKVDGTGKIIGIRKFVDSLPGLGEQAANDLGQYIPIAVADTQTYPGSDYYEIALIQYSEKLHKDLPPTLLRGYVQIETSAAQIQAKTKHVALTYPNGSPILNASGAPVYAVDQPHYLGPMILAQSNLPTRVKFTNYLPAGSGGDLFIPMDPTVMGAGDGPQGVVTGIQITDPGAGYTTAPTVTLVNGGGKGAVAAATIYNGALNNILVTNEGSGYTSAPTVQITGGGPGVTRQATATASFAGPLGGQYTQNRATLHLHGGNTPWISDGTPHQWVTPVGENATYPKGVSVYNVPDMADPGPGSETFFYTNEQSARLMFYHDHSYGLTRLNVYAGEAAGYLVSDPVEQALISGGTIPGTSVTVAANTIPADQIPLIIQDKTFVDASRINTQDPTWNWGSTPGTPRTGDLWFPHVYMPNQNPYDMMGVNAMGRWDYGPWFWPPYTGLLNGPVANPLAGTTMEEGPVNPGIPNPSIVPEGFMDTPLVNGTAYPTLTVQPKAYRLRILNAANDRTFNLQLYKAKSNGAMWDPTTGSLLDPNAGEVNMVPAVPNAGLPATWPKDGRDGGVPDPASAGPDWVQIGTEGGLLPAPAVIPATPVGYEYNRRSVTVLNVENKSLMMGPAERADVIVDFSAYAGQTLILYNDAPAPVPAFDPRNDYFTGDPDNTDTGGAPSTLPGYGPNTRTIMQIKVAASTPAPAYNLDALNAALPAAYAASQPAPLVPQAAYDAAYNASFPTDTSAYVRIQDTSLSFFNGPLNAINVTAGGSGYTSAPTVTINGGGGTGALATATVLNGKVTGITLDNGGSGFTSAPTVSITGGGGSGAAATAVGVNLTLEPKAIQELFTPDYGRMNATLGVELPNTNINVQTTLPLGYIDPPTEVIKDTADPLTPVGTLADGTQIWKITHNGVDTHAIHWHMFNVQLLNRVGWDGMVKPPDANEVGWKDTVRMNPLEDAIVALRPIKPTLPFKLGNSQRPMDVTQPLGSRMGFFTANPNNQPVTVTNAVVNFGWEYVWHCHLLGHEENDMMRPIIVAVAPEAPTGLVATGLSDPLRVKLTWQNSALNTTGFSVQRTTDPTWKDPAALKTFSPVGLATSYIDTSVVANTVYYYRVVANNTVGSTVPGYPQATAESVPSDVAKVGPPAAPSAVTASQPGVSGSAVTVQWTDNAPDAPNPPGFNAERAFTVQRGTTPTGPWSTLTTTVPAATGFGTTVTYSDTKAKKATTYYYRVLATNLFGSSPAAAAQAPITTK